MSVTVRNVGEAGRGLVALKDIATGELIIRDTAVIAIPTDVDAWEAGEKIVRQLKKMISTEKKEFYKLIHKDDVDQFDNELMDDTCDEAERYFEDTQFCDEISIFFHNDISTDDSFRCLFLYLSFLNHSCDPNSFWIGTVSNSRQLELRAAKDIKEGEEVTVNYILVEGRFSDRSSRQDRLREGWGFCCSCSLCLVDNPTIHQQKQEILKEEIVLLQSDMNSECDQNPATVSWARLCSLQSELVELVGQLSCGQLLLGRELKSWANLAQLARREDMLENALNSWNLIILQLGVERWRGEYKSLVEKLEKWKLSRTKKEIPREVEIRQFLWLM